MAKVIGINASPRLRANSAKLVEAALKGAEERGAETLSFDLARLDFSGCKSCFACKKTGGESFGRCGLRDELSELLSALVDDQEVSGFVIAMPIYFGDVPGMARNFFERLWFPGLLYDKDHKLAYDKRMKIGLIYDMNCPDPSIYTDLIAGHKRTMEWLLGTCETLCVSDTLQFDDYSAYSSSMFDPQKKLDRYKNHFPMDLAKAKELGGHLV